MPNGPLKITGLTFDEETVASECQIEDEDLKVHILYMYIHVSFSKYFNFQNHSEAMNFLFNKTIFVDRPCLLSLRPERLLKRRRRRQENQWLNRQKMQIRENLIVFRNFCDGAQRTDSKSWTPVRRKWLFKFKTESTQAKMDSGSLFYHFDGDGQRDISIVFQRSYHEIIFYRTGICVGLSMANTQVQINIQSFYQKDSISSIYEKISFGLIICI